MTIVAVSEWLGGRSTGVPTLETHGFECPRRRKLAVSKRLLCAVPCYGQFPFETTRLSLVKSPSWRLLFSTLFHRLVSGQDFERRAIGEGGFASPKLLVDPCPIGREMIFRTKTRHVCTVDETHDQKILGCAEEQNYGEKELREIRQDSISTRLPSERQPQTVHNQELCITLRT